MPTDSSSTESGALLDRSGLITSAELAEFLVIAPKTLRQWRYLGKGPESVRVGRCVRYDPAAVRRWLAERTGPEAA